MTLADSTITLDSLLEQDLAPETRMLGPFLDPTVTLIHAPAGVGKTLFVHEVAISVASGLSAFSDNRVPNWGKGDTVFPVAIVDGEMALRSLRARLLSQLAGRSANIHLLTNAELSDRGEALVEINRPDVRDDIDDWIESIDGLRLVIFDNLTTLTGPGFDEDSATHQRPLNQWFASLRNRGISTILVHHDAKSGTQRGSSDRESIMDLIIHLSRSPLAEGKGAHFNVDFTKARWLESQPEPFSARMIGNRWEFRSKDETRVDQMLNIMDIVKQWSWKDMSQEMKVSKSRVYAIRDKCRRMGWWDEDWDGRSKPKAGE